MTSDVMTGNTAHDNGSPEEIAPRNTGEVRIVGAQRAAEARGSAGEAAAPTYEDSDPTDDETGPPEPVLPHWTEAPTGEVPAVLSRHDDARDDPWAAAPKPSWREEGKDWDLEEPLAPSLLRTDPTPFVAERDAFDRQPWSFELDEPERELVDLDEVEDAELAGLGSGGLFGAWGDEGTGEDPYDVPTGEVRLPAGDPAAGAPPFGEYADEPFGPGDEEAGAPGTDDADAHADVETPAMPGRLDDDDPDTVAGERTSVLHRAAETPAEAAGALDEDAEPGEPAELDGRPSDTRAEEEAAALAADRAARGRRLARRTEQRGPVPVARHGAGGARTDVGAGVARGADAVSRKTGRNIPVAVASGLVIGALALVAFHFGTIPSMVVVTVVVGLAAAEAYAAFRRGGYRPATLLGLPAVVALLVATYLKGFDALPPIIVVLVAFTFLWHLVGVDPKAQPVRSTAATLLVFSWVGVFGSFAALLLAPSLFPHRTGIAYLLGGLVAAVAYDVGALAVGAALGRHPLSAVSPAKTWEGLAGGTVAALAFSIGVVHLIHPWTLAETVVLGVVVSVVSPIGDLCESMVKRHLGLKDMGRMLPGHGGILDRIDGLLFVLPAVFYLVRAFHH